MSETVHSKGATENAWILLFLFFAWIFPSVAVFSYMVMAREAASTQLLYAASKILQFALPLIWYLVLRQAQPRHWRLDKKDLLEGLATGLLLLVGLWALYFGFLKDLTLVQDAKPLIFGKADSFGAGTPLRFFVFCLFIAIVHSLLEEYYWRGFIHAEFERRLPGRIAIRLSALGFTGHHIVVIAQYTQGFWVGLFSVFVYIAGLLWAWQYRRRQSLLGAWLSHFMADVAILSLGYLVLFS